MHINQAWELNDTIKLYATLLPFVKDGTKNTES